jgi:hypothetical protein
MVLSETQPDRTLYLAVPKHVHDSFLNMAFGQRAIREHHLKIIVLDEKQEAIFRWIE